MDSRHLDPRHRKSWNLCLPDHYVPRPRLLQSCGSGVLVEAPGGWGKSVFMAEYQGWWRSKGYRPIIALLRAGDDWRSLTRKIALSLEGAGLSSVAAATSAAQGPAQATAVVGDHLLVHGEPLLLAIDGVHHATPDTAAMIAAWLDQPNVVAFLAGRLVPSELVAAANRRGMTRIGPRELTMTTEEAVALLELLTPQSDPATLAAVAGALQGWPGLLTLAGLQLRAGTDPGTVINYQALVSAVCEMAVKQLPEHVQEAVRQLACLPMFNAAMAGRIAGEGILRRLADAGLPLITEHQGWISFPESVSDALRAGADASEQTAKTAAELYFRRQEYALALDVLMERDLVTQAAHVLSRVPHNHLVDLGDGLVDGLMRRVTDQTLREHPECGLAYMHRLLLQIRMDEWNAFADRMLSLGTSLDPVVRRQVEAEKLVEEATSYAADYEDVIRRCQRILATVGPGETVTRVKALMALARSYAQPNDAGRIAHAERIFKEAVVAAEHTGQPTLLISVLLAYAYCVLHVQGRFEEADTVLFRAQEALPLSIHTARRLAHRADNAIAAGWFDRAGSLLSEAESVLAVLRREDMRDDITGWPRLTLASARGDWQEVTKTVSRLARTPTGRTHRAWIMSECAIAMARLERLEDAQRYLQEARKADGYKPPVVTIAELAVGCRTGWGPLEEAARTMLEDPDLEPREVWRVHLYLAVGRLNRDDIEAAEAAYREAMRTATEIHRRLPAAHEPELLALLTSAFRDASRPATITIRCLGGFHIDGRNSQGSLGKVPAALVKFLCVVGGRVSLSAVTDALWDEADDNLGRRRLRNVLVRVRRCCGDIIVRDGTSLTLAGHVSVDVLALHETAALVKANDFVPESRLREIAQGWAGDLLPEDQELWLETYREAARRSYLAITDRLAELARERGDLRDEIRWLEAGYSVALYEESRMLRVIQLLEQSGQHGQALQAYRRMREEASGPC